MEGVCEYIGSGLDLDRKMVPAAIVRAMLAAG
jgi:hypothetical protein